MTKMYQFSTTQQMVCPNDPGFLLSNDFFIIYTTKSLKTHRSLQIYFMNKLKNGKGIII